MAPAAHRDNLAAVPLVEYRGCERLLSRQPSVVGDIGVARLLRRPTVGEFYGGSTCGGGFRRD